MNEIIETPYSDKRADKPKFLTKTLFKEFDLPDKVLAGLSDAGFTHCTPIQARVLPLSLTGRDVAGQAQTGTGKTAAFLVTIFTRLMSLPKPGNRLPYTMVIAPTRELAHQIYEEAMVLGDHTDFKMVEVVGGVDYTRQAELLREGADLVICTPGRIIDYFKQGIFKTSGIRMVVIDEADRLLDLGFAKDMRYILRNLPHYLKRQSMLFSATLSYRVMDLTYEYMNLPEFIAVAPEEITVDGIEQTLHHVGKDKKFSLLLGILMRETPHRCMIFVNTKAGVEWLTKKLKRNQWPAEGITGDLPQRRRFRIMEGFKKGRLKILVATDVASRGIHVEDVSHVINYDLPQDAENYIHRIGRTARAGKSGRAISLACEDYIYHLEPLEEMLKCKIPVVWAKDDWFVKDQVGTVIQKPRSKKPAPAKARDSRKQRAPEKIPKKSAKRSPGHFPGKSFGFMPPPDVPETPDDSKEKKTESEGKSGRRKRCARARRKKKPSAQPTTARRRTGN
ncbi:MAG: RNA helicase [Deltaproteobacteria bacterium]|nr:MAG: RNA helicase [Deltaproteobacteria bacterium]